MGPFDYDAKIKFYFASDPDPKTPTWGEFLFGPLYQQGMNHYERNTMTTWTEVSDPTTLKEGDRIKVTYQDAVLEGTLGYEVYLQRENTYQVVLEGFPESDVRIPIEGSKFFLAEAPFAPLGRALEPGEIVEDNQGRKYTLNPLNPALVIDSLSGMPGTEDFAYTYVRPVR